MYWVYLIVLMASAFAFSLIGCWLVRKAMIMLGYYDEPNARSNHSEPIPTGGGLAVMIAILGFLMIVNAPGPLLVAALLLTGISFVDDVRGLSVKMRFGMQAIAVVIAYSALHGGVFQGLVPMWVEIPLVLIVWLWMVNLYNFMDGIDGITGAQTISMCVGVFILFLSVNEMNSGLAGDGLIIVAAVAAFLLFNWHPARLFLGDAGSVPLGLMMGYMLLRVAESGYWAAALILPAYYLADATVTLLRRAMAGEKIWQAHSKHFYQQAVRAGYPHNAVVEYIVSFNMMLAVLAVMSTLGLYYALAALVIAYAGAGAMLWFFTRPPVVVAEVIPPASSSTPNDEPTDAAPTVAQS